MGRLPTLTAARAPVLATVVLVVAGAPGSLSLAQFPPTPEQRSCDLRATRGYCIGMTAMTPGVDEMVASCATDGGTLVGVCSDDDTIAWCSLAVAGDFHRRAYHYSGRGAHRWTVARARDACTRVGGEFQLTSD